MRTRSRQRLPVLMVVLLGLTWVVSNRAQEPSKESQGLADYIAAIRKKCEKLKEEVAQKQQQLAARSQAASSDPQASTRITRQLREAESAVEQIRQLTTQAPPRTAAEKESYARALSEALGKGSMAKRSLDRELGVGSVNVIERLVDRDALSTFGKGSPSSNVGFDSSKPRTSNWEIVRVGGSELFRQSPPVTVTEYTPIRVEEAKRIKDFYGSGPEGLVLEGTATGLGAVRQVRYEPAYNALVLDDRAVYFAKIPPWTLSSLCKAIAEDNGDSSTTGSERVGVSMGRVFISYGKTKSGTPSLPVDSALAQDLFLIDKFLADIVFAENDWTVGYKFKDGFVPEKRKKDDSNIAVSFTFDRFQFQIRQDVILLTQSGFNVKIWPVSETPAKDGGGQPDEEAIRQGRTFPEFERNAQHLVDNMDYYRRERIVERAFSYGEAAALIRTLKAARIDLQKLAKDIISLN